MEGREDNKGLRGGRRSEVAKVARECLVFGCSFAEKKSEEREGNPCQNPVTVVSGCTERKWGLIQGIYIALKQLITELQFLTFLYNNIFINNQLFPRFIIQQKRNFKVFIQSKNYLTEKYIFKMFIKFRNVFIL